MIAENNIILLGGGGHAKVLIELMRLGEQYEIAGILDPALQAQAEVLGIPVLGGDDRLIDLRKKGIINACVAVGTVRSSTIRKRLYSKAKRAGFSLPHFIHPKAIVSESVHVSPGVQIMAGAIVQGSTFIGENTLINTGTIIDHDCTIGKHVHVCPGAVISGGCTIGNDTFIGVGTTVIHGITIGPGSTVAAGSVVIRDVPPGVTVKGIPASAVLPTQAT